MKKAITRNFEKMTTDDLEKLFISTRGKINRARKNHMPTKRLEMDLCYIQREIEERHRNPLYYTQSKK